MSDTPKADRIAKQQEEAYYAPEVSQPFSFDIVVKIIVIAAIILLVAHWYQGSPNGVFDIFDCYQ